MATCVETWRHGVRRRALMVDRMRTAGERRTNKKSEKNKKIKENKRKRGGLRFRVCVFGCLLAIFGGLRYRVFVFGVVVFATTLRDSRSLKSTLIAE